MSEGAVQLEDSIPRAQHPEQPPPGFELMREERPPGLLRRILATQRHLTGLALGGLIAHVRARRADTTQRRGLRFAILWIAAAFATPWVRKELRRQPFPVQFRRRLELLGPTYVKLGQILSLREDLLPPELTGELKNLLDRLPVVTFARYRELLEKELGRPIEQMFTSIEARPLGSASIAQIHRAWTVEGEAVILKVVKPGIRETLKRDAVLLRGLGGLLQLFLGRYQPKRMIDEFVRYTELEVDLEREADNAETFAANFRDTPDIVFPRVYRQYSSRRVLCLEYFKGFRPDDPRAKQLSEKDRGYLVDLGAQAIIRMLYRDGFFHADLHPGNLFILPGPKCGFIDLGMVGRFDDELRRSLLYYFYCLVMGDSENAARYLSALADAGPGSDPAGFRREVEEICRRWSKNARFDGFSLGQLVLMSLTKAGRYRVYFPVELVLMAKALITFEGVGQILEPGLDIAKVSRHHAGAIFIQQFHPLRLAREGLRGAPDIVDAFVKAPALVTEGLRVLERATRQPQPNPLAGLRSTLFAGACVVAGAIAVTFDGPPLMSGGLFRDGTRHDAVSTQKLTETFSTPPSRSPFACPDSPSPRSLRSCSTVTPPSNAACSGSQKPPPQAPTSSPFPKAGSPATRPGSTVVATSAFGITRG